MIRQYGIVLREPGSLETEWDTCTEQVVRPPEVFAEKVSQIMKTERVFHTRRILVVVVKSLDSLLLVRPATDFIEISDWKNLNMVNTLALLTRSCSERRSFVTV